MVQTRISDLDLSLAHHTASPTLEHNDLTTRAIERFLCAITAAQILDVGLCDQLGVGISLPGGVTVDCPACSF